MVYIFGCFEILWLRLNTGAMLLLNYFALKVEAARLTNERITAQFITQKSKHCYCLSAY
jgi:hypothetical protein